MHSISRRGTFSRSPFCHSLQSPTKFSTCSAASSRFKFKENNPGWNVIVGIEVHAQIKSRTKLFSNSLNHDSLSTPVNKHVSLFDAAFPGTLPTLNPKCVELALRTALALNAEVQSRSSFDRKHYFYADLPAGYQITQNYAPLAKNGRIDLPNSRKSVRIKQIQLEQDTAKSTVQPDGATFLDLNRAGVALMEIVSQPDMHSPEEAGEFLRTLQQVLRSIGTSDGHMEEGSLRCDVNVSVYRDGEAPMSGTRCEIKNLNSVKSVMIATNAEAHRQMGLLEWGERVTQQTLYFDEHAAVTHPLRLKEDAQDYRYMPDPNIPPIMISQALLAEIKENMPELSHQSRRRLAEEYGLESNDVDILLGIDTGRTVGWDGALEDGGVWFFEAVVDSSRAKRDPKAVLNWMLHELLGQLAYRNETFAENALSVDQCGAIIDAVRAGIITSTTGKNVLRHILQTKTTAPVPRLIDELSLRTVDSISVEALCDEAIRTFPEEADLIRRGKKNILMKLVGYVMKASRGGANPKLTRRILELKLTARK